MDEATIYLESVKRTLRLIYGSKASPRRVLETAVAGLNAGELSVENLRTSFYKVFPVETNQASAIDLQNYRLSLEKLEEKNRSAA